MPRKTRNQKRKQKGGGVVNRVTTLRRKLQQREANRKREENTPLPKSFGPHMAKVRQNEKNARVKVIINEIESLRTLIEELDPPKGRYVNISSIYKSPAKTIDELPVKFYTFINSPAIGGASPFGGYSGPQYSQFEKKLMPQILNLRSEAFPEDYGFNSEGLKSRMIKLFGTNVAAHANADKLLWITPYHCEPIPDTPSEENIICSLIVVPPVERNDRLMYLGDRRVPNLLSSCTLIKCKVDDIEVTELYGLATFAEYQKQGLGKDLLLRVLQMLSNLHAGALTNTRLLQNKYIWLFYKKEKSHLKTLYEGAGFVPINGDSESPIHKKLYISPEFLLENARQAKMASFINLKKRRNPYEVNVVNEEDLPEFLEAKKQELNKRLYKRLEYSRDYFFRPSMLLMFPEEEIDKIDIKRYFADDSYKRELEELYFNAWYKHVTSERVQFLVIVNKAEREKIMELSPEEEAEATEFTREEQQMVLCLADWVARRIA